jgi:hypothetical protein
VALDQDAQQTAENPDRKADEPVLELRELRG